LVTLPKIAGLGVLGSVVIQLYAGECTPSVDRALSHRLVIFQFGNQFNFCVLSVNIDRFLS